MMVLDSLRKTFLDDHKTLTRGLRALLDAMEAGDWQTARQRAEELDRAVGSHMAFEEEVYYPKLSRVLGSDFVDRLYHEHSVGVEAIRTLTTHPIDQPLSPQDRDRIVTQLKTAFEHAKSCGTLMSHLKALSSEEQTEMLETLEDMRRHPQRWTEIASKRSANF